MAIEDLEGYPEFQRAVTKIARDFPQVFQETSINVAREWLSLAQSAARTAQQSLAARTLSATPDSPGAGNAGASIQSSSGMFAGSEFGGQGRPETMQFPPYQGKRGYFLFPAARANAARLNDMWQTALEAAMKPWNHRE